MKWVLFACDLSSTFVVFYQPTGMRNLFVENNVGQLLKCMLAVIWKSFFKLNQMQVSVKFRR